MRKISADIVFPVDRMPIENGVVVLDENDRVIEVGRRKEYDEAELEIHNGVLTPGFVNAHCHLELSFLKDQIPQKTGLIEFVKQVVSIRDNFSTEEQKQAIEDAENEMVENGIVAVGDISNDSRSFFQKEKGNLLYHTFVEVFDLGPANTNAAFEKGKEVYANIPVENGSKGSMTPHAPYSCTNKLNEMVDEFTAADGKILSIHMQEQKDENRLFHEKDGPWVQFFKDMGLDFSWFDASGKNSLESMMEHMKHGNKKVFIHNTNTEVDDISWAHNFAGEVYWCFCPNANLYIENKLPDYRLFFNAAAKCVIGTDSLASNHQLSILEEMKIITRHAPYIPFYTILRWATLNGAKLLDFEKQLGSFTPGKKPGVNLIEGMQLRQMLLPQDAKVRRLV